MASNSNADFLVDSQVGVHKIHFKRADKSRSCIIRNCFTHSYQGIDSESAGLFRIDQVTKYTGLCDIAFYCSDNDNISQHNMVLACPEGFSCSSWEMANSGSGDHRFKHVCVDFNFCSNRLDYGDNVI